MSDKRLKIYNTLTRKKETFTPLLDQGKKDFVWIYTCGPTVYSEPHVGNMRAYIFADSLRSVIKNIMWYDVKHVVNITDVGHLTDDGDFGEDKLEKGSRIEWLSARDVARKYENRFKEYLKWLKIEFDYFPRATDNIQEQIDVVKLLEEKWYTYEIPGDGIYFDSSKYPEYGRLLGENYKEILAWLEAGQRIDMWGKKNSTDFSLWKFSKPEEKRQMERDSPWWIGFPGWHIECTAMSEKILGREFDIHTGWYDHISIHHPNEMAQNECAFGIKDNVKYWMHVQFLNIKWEKISKSKGNFTTMNELNDKWFSAQDFRYMILNTHYRNFMDFERNILESFHNSRQNIVKKLVEISRTLDKLPDFGNVKLNYIDFADKYLPTQEGKKLFAEIIDFIFDDLDIGNAFTKIHESLKSYSPEIATDLLNIIFYLDENLFKLELKKAVEDNLNFEAPAEIKELAQKRWEAKLMKNFDEADKIREQIKSKWYDIKDNKDWFEIIKI